MLSVKICHDPHPTPLWLPKRPEERQKQRADLQIPLLGLRGGSLADSVASTSLPDPQAVCRRQALSSANSADSSVTTNHLIAGGGLSALAEYSRRCDVVLETLVFVRFWSAPAGQELG
jgi:hypothetical protein